ncbi:hypothetical protein EV189_2324 [Motilibacter rhizosphaerae]|uniref:Gametolysin peptidase M11 n=1 Tax=Motilibacter rhizosphaerae TaxID=598652 RepID=A0A4Q7NPK9_9ACTN|nr:hypothetical protein [Motilibacter rhizosphaerae]RZS86906.1 hypothetical protein EV189_2324 [Motilibacter rhizosphaerae]
MRRTALLALVAAVTGLVTAAPADAAPATTVQGRVTDVDVDYAPGATGPEHRHVLRVGASTVDLASAGLGDVPGGTHVAVSVAGARSSTEALQALATGGSSATVTDAYTSAMTVPGVHSTIIVPVKWGSGTNPRSATSWRTVVDKAWGFWSSETGGLVTEGSVTVKRTVTVTDPGDCSTDPTSQALSLARVNPSTTSAHVVVVFPTMPGGLDSTCVDGWLGLGEVGGNVLWLADSLTGSPSATTGSETYAAKVLGHELGHNLGLGHANAYSCGTLPLAAAASCTEQPYQDYSQIMGYGFGTLAPPQAQLLGALPSAAVTDVTGPGTWTLAGVDTGTGLRALRLTIPLDGANASVYLDAETPTSVRSEQTAAPAGYPGWTGLVARVVDGDETRLLDLTPTGPTGAAGTPALGAGGSWAVPGTSLTVNVTSADATGATVQVTSTSAAPAWAAAPVRTDRTTGWANPTQPVSLSWTAPSDATGLVRYEVLADSTVLATLPPGTTSATVTPGAARDGSSVTLAVRAWNAGGLATVATLPLTADSTPPSVPLLAVPPQTIGPLQLSWPAATDAGSGLDHYLLRVDGGAAQSLAGSVTGTMLDLPVGAHTVALAAVDAAGNTSAVATASSTRVTPPPPPVPAPVVVPVPAPVAAAPVPVPTPTPAPVPPTFTGAAVTLRLGPVSPLAIPLSVSGSVAAGSSALCSYTARADGRDLLTAASVPTSVPAAVAPGRRSVAQTVTDCSGRSANSSAHPVVTLTAESTSVWTGIWLPVSRRTALGGRMLASAARGSALAYTFNGTSVGVAGPRGPGNAPFDVYLDGRKVARVDPSRGTGTEVLWAAAVPAGKHVVKVGVGKVGRNTLVRVDGFLTVA